METVEGQPFDTALTESEREALLPALGLQTMRRSIVIASLYGIAAAFFIARLLLSSSVTGMWLSFAACTSFLALAFLMARKPLQIAAILRGDQPAAVTFGPEGMTFDRPSARIPYRKIQNVIDTPYAIAIVYNNWVPLTVSRRGLDDGGAALWKYLDARLTGRGMLFRPTASPQTIYNTAFR